MKKFQDLDQGQLNYQLYRACRQGKLVETKYLLTSPDLKIHADIESSDIKQQLKNRFSDKDFNEILKAIDNKKLFIKLEQSLTEVATPHMRIKI